MNAYKPNIKMIDGLLLNVQRQIFHAYSGRKQDQYVDLEKWTSKGRTFKLPLENCGQFSLVTGRLLTTQNVLLQRVFNVLRS